MARAQARAPLPLDMTMFLDPDCAPLPAAAGNAAVLSIQSLLVMRNAPSANLRHEPILAIRSLKPGLYATSRWFPTSSPEDAWQLRKHSRNRTVFEPSFWVQASLRGCSQASAPVFTKFLQLGYDFQNAPYLASIVKASRRHMGSEQTASNSPYRYQDPHLEVDFVRKYASVDARRLVLTRKEYELLALLVENAGEIIPRPILLMRIWGYSNEIRTRTLDVHVRRLRKKLGQYSEQYIETIFGIGYRFQPFRLKQRFSSGISASPIAVGM